MKISILLIIVLLVFWVISHFYFCHYSFYYKTHVPTIALVEGVVSVSYVGIAFPFPLQVDSGIKRFEGNEGILPTIFPEFRISRLNPGWKPEDGFRIGIPFWLLFLLLISCLFWHRILTFVRELPNNSKLRTEQASDGNP